MNTESPDASTPGFANIEAFMDMPVKVQIEMANCLKPAGELLRYSPGTVIVFDKSVNSEVDVYVNRQLVARGEVVVADSKMAIKVTEIVTRI